MAIDLRQVEPLGSKSVLLEQALKRHKAQGNGLNLGDMSDMVSADYDWLNEDKTAIQSLVQQMDASIGQLAVQMRDMNEVAAESRSQVEKEQQLLFKQIKTLNGLLKKQVSIVSAVERQMQSVEVKNNSLLPQVGIGLMAGLMSAITILATAPWMTILMENLRQ